MKGKWKLTTLVLVIGLVTLGGCLKDDDNGIYQVSAVRALNAIPGSDQLDIGLNESWLNYDLQTNEVEDFAYRDTLPYKKAWPGTRTVRVVERDNATADGLLAEQEVQFVPGQFYSLYVVGMDDEVSVMFTADNLSAPPPAKAKIRFINLSPDAPGLDFGVEGADTLIANDIAFKGVNDFSVVDGDETYTFNVVEHNSGEVVHAFTFKPESNRIYTMWVRGLFESADDVTLALGHDILVH